MIRNGIKLVSALIGLLLLIITLSIKISSAITDDSDDSHSDTDSDDGVYTLCFCLFSLNCLAHFCFFSVFLSIFLFLRN